VIDSLAELYSPRRNMRSCIGLPVVSPIIGEPRKERRDRPKRVVLLPAVCGRRSTARNCITSYQSRVAGEHREVPPDGEQ